MPLRRTFGAVGSLPLQGPRGPSPAARSPPPGARATVDGRHAPCRRGPRPIIDPARPDLTLRRAFWAQGRCTSLRHVIFDIAEEMGAVDIDVLAGALDSGSARAAIMARYEAACDGRVTCSPHVFPHDGTNRANPGIEASWENAGFGTGYPVIDKDGSEVYADLLNHAAGRAGVGGQGAGEA
ncbi:hypothetical protein ABT071_26360 [Streptomyces sp. NPDC002506]|uniref:hypothetical protein n=1 Tax=Streptomyces sp. NPDC002506 TaxID=3154536 RepID=UPI00331FD8ED